MSTSSSPGAAVRDGAARRRSKTIVVLGSAYGGSRAAKLLSDTLPTGWRLIVIDRNTHFNHVYAFPRYTVLSKYAPLGYVPRDHDLDPSPETILRERQAVACGTNGLPTPPLTPTPSLGDLRHENSLSKRRQFIHASVVHLSSHAVSITRPGPYRAPPEQGTAITGPSGHFEGPEETIPFDYCLYALGAALPDPTNPWSEHPNIPQEVVHDHVQCGLGSKKWGVRWMEQRAENLKRAERIVIVGAGALGIQFAADLKDVYPEKEVTLLHSRTRVLPIYPQEMHDEVMKGLKKLRVNVVLGERVVEWPDGPERLDGRVKRVVTDKGSVFEGDLVLPCTGQRPHSQYMEQLCPDSVSPTSKRIRVLPTLQVSTDPTTERHTLEQLSSLSLSPPSPSSSSTGSDHSNHADHADHPDLSHIFAIGDCADTGAIQAGHTAYYMGEVAARNIVRLIDREDGRGNDELEVYKYGAPAIKVTLGLRDAVISTAEGTVPNSEGKEDLYARLIWDAHGAGDMPDDA